MHSAALDTSVPAESETRDAAVVTNDIFTREDAEFLVHHQALPAERIAAVETGGCPAHRGA